MAGSIQPGQLVDQYKIEKLSGQDKLRDRYSAYEVDSGQPVSLFVLKQEYVGIDLFVQDYLHRTQSLTQIRHPNLTKYQKTGVFDGSRPFVSMQPVTGFSLGERLDRLAQGQVSAHTIYALTLVQQIASGLALIERLDLYHFELTPDHIQLRSVTLQGEESVVVADLDVPHQYAGEFYEYSDYAASYLSPEQLSGKEIDGRSHVFTLGVILHELLCGQRPANAMTRRRKLWSALSGGSTLEQLRPNLAPETYKLVERSLYRNRRRRYASLAAFQEALDRALEVEDVPKHVKPAELTNKPRPVFLIPLLLLLICGALGLLSLWLAPGLRDDGSASVAIAGQDQVTVTAAGAAESPGASPTPSPTVEQSPTTRATDQPELQTRSDSEESAESLPAAAEATETQQPSRTAIIPPTATATATSLPSPTPAPTQTPKPAFRVLASSANLRLGPGTVYDPVGFVYQDEELEIVARSDGDYIWLNVLAQNGQRGWIAAGVGELARAEALSEIQTAATIPVPPTPTYTPTPTDTPMPPTALPPPSSGGGGGGGGNDKPRATPTPPL